MKFLIHVLLCLSILDKNKYIYLSYCKGNESFPVFQLVFLKVNIFFKDEISLWINTIPILEYSIMKRDGKIWNLPLCDIPLHYGITRKLMQQLSWFYLNLICKVILNWVLYILYSFSLQALADNSSLIFVKPIWIAKCHDKSKFVPFQPYVVVPSESD